MDNKVLLAKTITLLFRESLLTLRVENSGDLVRTVLQDVKLPEASIGINTEKDILQALKTTALDMCSQPNDHIYEIDDLLQRIRINCAFDDKLYDAIRSGIMSSTTMDEGHIKSSIVAIRKAIHNHFRTQQIQTVLRKASSVFTYEQETIKDVNQFLNELVGQLEALSISTNAKDPAVMEEIDIENETQVKAAFDSVKENGSAGRIYKLGWDELNEMTQGGLRSGETVVINALQHKYKTGLALTMFDQLARYNQPKTKDPTKKPMLLRISFEDSAKSNLQFFYQRLKHDETGEFVDITTVSSQEMTEYVKAKLQLNGFTIKLMRIDPTQWTYKSIFNKVLELEAQGYNIEVLALDYLMLVPTTGCINSGPTGTDMRDLLRRVRNFCAAKDIVHLTPHQLNTEAKKLLRGGLPDVQFLPEIAQKGYTAGSGQLDQEMDLELYSHIFKHGKDTYFAMQIGKHRLPTVIAEEKKFFLKKFPKGMPIPDSKEGDVILRRLPSASISNASSDFAF